MNRLCRVFLVGVLAAAAGVGLFAMAGCDRSRPNIQEAPPPPRVLTIVTPHNERIREVFGAAFQQWMHAQRGDSVVVSWVALGTPECMAYAEALQRNRGQRESRERGDVLFGGGITDHEMLAQRKLSLPLRLDDLMKDIPAEIGGLPTRSATGQWCATGLSSFGIVFNQRALQQRGIAPPQGWDDLADPRFAGWLGLADPAASGSHLQCMSLVLQKHGWEAGWAQIVRMLANSRALVERSSTAIRQTQTGVFLVSMAVNFDGLLVERQSGGAVVYRNPPGASALTPAAVSVLSATTDEALATDFVRFCLSEVGQQLWAVTPESGDPLFHYPVLPSIYEKFADSLAISENPIASDPGIRFDLEAAARHAALLPPLVAAICRDHHVDLQQTWAAVVAAGMPPAALAELTGAPFNEAAARELADRLRNDPAAADSLAANWSREFAQRLERTRALLKP